jgi:PfaD family protein
VRLIRDRSTGRVVVIAADDPTSGESEADFVGSLPALFPEWLGDRGFGTGHGARFAYLVGEMANGIAGTRMVTEAAEAGMIGMFGAAGLSYDQVCRAVGELRRGLAERRNWGVNLIHSPAEPDLENRVAALLVDSGVPIVSLSAYMAPTPALVHCAVAGLRVDRSGRIRRRAAVFAKLSRPEVAEWYLSPAPADLLRGLVERGAISATEAALAERVPLADHVTVEADSGGHTDNRPLGVLLPTIVGVRADLKARFGYLDEIRIGAGGGLGTPTAVAGAFALGADYVLTGSINQSAVEADLSDDAKALLAQADIADIGMAPASDMFEAGIKLQVLRRGTMFAGRAQELYDAYTTYPTLEDIPPQVRCRLESDVLHETFDQLWHDTVEYWTIRDPGKLEQARREPRHRMALLFRGYLGQASRWAITGYTPRRLDYQIWCGPAMGAFNRWVDGSFLADLSNRTVVQIGRNLMEGAAVVTRAQQLRNAGVVVPPDAFAFRPRRLA